VQLKEKPELKKITTCFHCGDICPSLKIISSNHHFCCEGCKMVYEILNENSMCEYYDLEKNPGITQKFKIREGKFSILDDETIQQKYILFKDESTYNIEFYLPQMHCSSCVWLLENLNKIDKGIIHSQVNFLKKHITVKFTDKNTSIRKIAELLTRIGYEPHLSLSSISTKPKLKTTTSTLIKIGVSGFCFGNIMLLSFPEYFSIQYSEGKTLSSLFSYINLALAIPVFFYSASDFFISAYKGLREKFLNIDAPIALAILITFIRSIIEITTQSGAGYFDSMSGIVFFMLLGRYFQNKTYDAISFDRDFTSYFPLGITLLNHNNEEKQIAVSKLKVGDRIKIYNDEIIPVDALLFKGKASIDYSFVTGESAPVKRVIGEIIYAGGKQTGESLELEVIKEVSQSYLTQLWNNESFNSTNEDTKNSFVHSLSKYFTLILFGVALITSIYWLKKDPSKILDAVTAVLIVACPCALLLSSTFTNGSMLNFLAKKGIYIKSATSLEKLQLADTIVLDKTGTITQQHESRVEFIGSQFSQEQKESLGVLFRQSSHPLSRLIAIELPKISHERVINFKEVKGCGLSAQINEFNIKAGSTDFLGLDIINHNEYDGSRVYVTINEKYYGFFKIKSKYRNGLKSVIKELKIKHTVLLLSGDNDSEQEKLIHFFGKTGMMKFNQKPQDKLNLIKQLQLEGRIVIMIGDGLNDAGALKQSNFGIAVSDNTNNFSPACDAILDGKSFYILDDLIKYAKKQKMIVISSFIISIVYNLIGLFYATQSKLEPVIAAILMPVSSISIVIFTVITSYLLSKKINN
jgi:Cu+-exporting ATPase